LFRKYDIFVLFRPNYLRTENKKFLVKDERLNNSRMEGNGEISLPFV
jgi:hypothetical protein